MLRGFLDGMVGNKIAVKKYEEGSKAWVTVGSEGFSQMRLCKCPYRYILL